MLVETLKAHGNTLGDKYEKSPGDIYECPEALADTLKEDGLVKRAGGKKAKV